jgi:hypothetical protein
MLRLVVVVAPVLAVGVAAFAGRRALRCGRSVVAGSAAGGLRAAARTCARRAEAASDDRKLMTRVRAAAIVAGAPARAGADGGEGARRDPDLRRAG